MNFEMDENNNIRVVLHQLDVILDNINKRFYLIINNKEMMDQNGKFEDINNLSEDVNNLGSIHNNVQLVRLFNM